MPPESEAVLSCLRDQRFGALEKANEVRSARAQLKRDIAAGKTDIVRVLSDPPVCAQTAMVRDLLLAVRKIGPARSTGHSRSAESLTPRRLPVSAISSETR